MYSVQNMNICIFLYFANLADHSKMVVAHDTHASLVYCVLHL